MRESRTYGSVRGAYDETHVPTATERIAACIWSLMAHSDQSRRCNILVAIGGKADAVPLDEPINVIAALAVALGAFDAKHVELAFDITEDEIGAGH